MQVRLIRLAIIKIIFLSLLMSFEKITIKVYHVFKSFGQETQELKNSTIMNFNSQGLMIDSTIYSHTIPLNKKYIYVTGKDEGLKLERTYEKEKVLSYVFEYNKQQKKISTTLYGTNDSLYWKEFYKYDDSGYLYKQIRYNPAKAINPEMVGNQKNGEMVWSEQYIYDKTGSSFNQRELYDNYALVVNTYLLDSLNNPKIDKEYFDPSVIFQIIYFHNDSGLLTHKIKSGYLGESLGSVVMDYDVLNRKIKKTLFNKKGAIEKIYDTVFDDKNYIYYDYYSDSLVNFSLRKETRVNNKGHIYIEALIDNKERLFEKNVYYYDNNNKIIEIKQYDMIRREISEKYKIPIRVHTYEYE